ncbi:hypothetical protein GCM10022409_17950 [Hymenobacter glaciei]|uniref:Uncharacterized protein n=1 Tax=Hymenobacter glaciei TaxID=877209 RepID=A0ABP7U0B5_9BACT
MLKIPLPRSQKYILGAFIFASFLYAFINREPAFGIPLLLLAVAVATTYSYVVLDFANGYKGEFTCLFGLIPLGGWERLPSANHVFLKRFSEVAQEEISDSGVYQTVRHQRYLIMLSVPDSRDGFLILKVLNLNKARKIAHKISLAGALELKDYTQ